jgi:HD-GYP domain-containing protein (c-di-GMP phosphodiesterase class II)
MIDLALEILQRVDPLLYQHSHRVSILATAIGKEMGLPAEIQSRLAIAGHLHDLALVGGSDALRAHQRELGKIANPTERDQIERHPALSAQLVRFLPLPDVIEAIEQHHEYFDGSGYPNQVAGSRLAQMTSILIVADCYDELPGGNEAALGKILSGAGHLYAADVAHALERAISKGLHTIREKQVLVHELVPGMKLSSSIYTTTGMLLVKQGQVLSRSLIEYLQLHAESNAIVQKIVVEA